MIQDNLFNYKRFVFLKWALLLTLVSTFAYLLDQPAIYANGGTWLGYTLGTIGALLILWLMWFGVRKRQYNNQSGNLRGWVSAHIYLGLSLAVFLQPLAVPDPDDEPMQVIFRIHPELFAQPAGSLEVLRL